MFFRRILPYKKMDDERTDAALSHALWAAAGITLLFRAAGVRHLSFFAQDFQVSYEAARNVFRGADLYSPDGPLLPFLYPPPSAIVFVPFTVLGLRAAEQLALVVGVAALVVATLLSARLADAAGAATRHTAGVALLLAALWQPSYDALANVNSTLAIAPVVPAFLLLTRSRRHLPAALVLGVSLAVKPLLLPLLVVPFLYRKPRFALLALAIPVVSTLVSLPFVADGRAFFADVLPRLARGDAGRLGANNMSLANFTSLAGTDERVVLVARIVVALCSVVTAALIWRSKNSETLRLVDTTGVLLVGFLSVGGTNESHFQLVLLPLVVTAMAPRSHLRSACGGLGVALFAYGGDVVFLSESAQASRSLWRALGLLVVIAAMSASAWRHSRAREFYFSEERHV